MKKIILYQIGIALTVIISYYLYINYFNEKELPEKRGYGWLVGIENEYERSRIPSKFYSLIPDKEGEKLVFRFSQIYCGSCVTREVRLLREVAKNIGWENIIFIATNSDENYLNRYKRVSQIETEIYNVPGFYFEMDREPLDTPYMFISDSDSSFKELFVSMKENEVRTKQYLDKVTRKYF